MEEKNNGFESDVRIEEGFHEAISETRSGEGSKRSSSRMKKVPQNFTLQPFRKSTKSLKSESRAAVLTAFLGHKERRMAAKLREEGEKHKVVDVWKEEAKHEKEKQLEDLFDRLSQKKTVIDEVKSKELEDMIKEKIQRSREKVRYLRETFYDQRRSCSIEDRLKMCADKKNKRLSMDTERKQQYFEEKLAKSDLVLMRSKEYRNQTTQLNRERREKKTLRSRVQNVLFKESKGKCERQHRNEERVETILYKDAINKMPKKVVRLNPLPMSMSQPMLDKLMPDEALLTYFSSEELRHV